MKVFVLNRRGQPLMPCSPAKARHLLEANKATVKCRTPFTIQLSISTGETKQDVILGVDAFCIAGNLKAQRTDVYLYQKQTRKHNRQIQKCSILKAGVRKLNQSPYLVKGFRLFDKVKCLGQVGFIFGRRASGYFDVRTLGGKKLSPAIHAKKLMLLERRRTFLTELRKENGASSPV